MSQYFSKPCEPFGGDVTVKADLSNYAANIKSIVHIDTSSLALKSNFASLKTEVDKLHIDKLAPVPVDLSKLSDVVKNDVVKKTAYDRFVTKVNSIDTSGLVLKTKYDADKTVLQKKFSDTSGLVKKTDYKTKIAEIESKIPSISNLATKTLLATVENKIPDISSLVKKIQKLLTSKKRLTDHNHDKHVTTPDCNTLASDIFNARLKRANLVAKANFDNNVSSLDRKIAANKTKIESIQNELKKLKTFDSSYFTGKSHFEEDGAQNYLVFQPLNKYFKVIANTDYVSLWKSKWLSAQTIKPPARSDNSLTRALSYYSTNQQFHTTIYQ